MSTKIRFELIKIGCK